MNNRRPRLLILTVNDFGYHIVTHYYCKYARSVLDITYLCLDSGREPISMDGVRVLRKRKFRRFGKGPAMLWWLALVFWHLWTKGSDVVFVKYFPGASLVRLLHPLKPMILDIRTGAVGVNRTKVKWLNYLIYIESLLYRHRTIISSTLAEKLGFSRQDARVLPLGGEPIQCRPKEDRRLDLLYVGTLSTRDLHKTVDGFARFYRDCGHGIPMSYTIVGDGHFGEREELIAQIAEKGLADVIRLPGYVPNERLQGYWDRANVGVSFVPINDVYDCQPPTKTYEYLLAGLPVIATNTSENRKVIHSGNGVLIEDTSDSFYEGLRTIVERLTTLDAKRIQTDSRQYSWEHIVHTHFLPAIAGVLENTAGKVREKRRSLWCDAKNPSGGDGANTAEMDSRETTLGRARILGHDDEAVCSPSGTNREQFGPRRGRMRKSA